MFQGTNAIQTNSGIKSQLLQELYELENRVPAYAGDDPVILQSELAVVEKMIQHIRNKLS